MSLHSFKLNSIMSITPAITWSLKIEIGWWVVTLIVILVQYRAMYSLCWLAFSLLINWKVKIIKMYQNLILSAVVQVNLCQKHLFLHQLTIWQKIVHWFTSSVNENYVKAHIQFLTYRRPAQKWSNEESIYLFLTW